MVVRLSSSSISALIFRLISPAICISFVSVASSSSTPMEIEREALVRSGWWSDSMFNNSVSDHCNWVGISCNGEGSITQIYPYDKDITGELSQLNFSCFPNLKSLDLNGNNISGNIPSEIGTLLNLKSLLLEHNSISGGIPLEICALSKLKYLGLSSNNIQGTIPPEIESLSNLQELYMEYNKLTGHIPSAIGKLTNMKELVLTSNRLSGHLPREVGNLKNLTHLYLGDNNLSGPLPSILGDLTHLTYIELSSNQFHSSSIPPDLGTCLNLKYLNLSSNKMSGTIPFGIGRLKNLKRLDLSHNQFEGSIPKELGTFLNLRFLLLKNNSFSKNILLDVCSLQQLYMLDLSYNFINGTIPFAMGNYGLQYLYLSHNNLFGQIPESLNNIMHIDLSYNNLEGKIPIARHGYARSPHQFTGNKGLCGQLKGFPRCSKVPAPKLFTNNLKDKPQKPPIRLLVILLPIIVVLVVLILGSLFFLKRKKKKSVEPNTRASNNGNMFSVWNFDGRIAYEEVIEATEDIDIKYCIDTRTYGSVYRAQLPSGRVVALKKLHSSEAEEQCFMRSFENEVHTLLKIRHRNIVKLYGFCLHKKCMFLIYEYMERGSLFCVLSFDHEAIELGWAKRVNVVMGMAHALSYLHHDCTPPIMHHDISSNNILLNLELHALVGDFGTTRLLQPDSSNRTLVAGTYRYIAPELAYHGSDREMRRL